MRAEMQNRIASAVVRAPHGRRQRCLGQVSVTRRAYATAALEASGDAGVILDSSARVPETRPMEYTAHIALGSNLGDRLEMLRRATARLASRNGVSAIAKTSSVWETAPRGIESQPAFLNAVLEVKTRYAPEALLAAALSVERSMGRKRAPGTRWGPRVIDLDLLLLGERVIDSPTLTIPHPRLHERAFVLVPLCEVLPDARHPVHGVPLATLRDGLSEQLDGVVRIAGPQQLWSDATRGRGSTPREVR